MKLKLVVLAGAKEGLEIPLKKEKFLIGRAKECALRAGSEAISRRHCAIIRRETGFTVRDLGSRNGTYVNDEKISKEVPIKEGDELRVGPLKFRVDAVQTKEAAAAGTPPPTGAKPRKQPPVKDVADVVNRTISLSDSATEDDVTRWLLDSPGDSPEMLKETRTLKAEETSMTLNRAAIAGESSTIEDISKLTGEPADASADAIAGEEEKEEGGSGVWKFFKRGKGAAGKKEPGKLPPRPEQQSKDSREAAADILREMTRRR
jgi:pSer/pThr/pTyr-binding forkhead associated (FHA) protein